MIHLTLNNHADAVRGLDDADTAGTVLIGHEQAHHFLHGDDSDLVGREQEQVLVVAVPDPLPTLDVLIPGDGIEQGLEPT